MRTAQKAPLLLSDTLQRHILWRTQGSLRKKHSFCWLPLRGGGPPGRLRPPRHPLPPPLSLNGRVGDGSVAWRFWMKGKCTAAAVFFC